MATKSGVLDDGVEYAPSPDHVGPAPGFDFKDQAPAVNFHELGEGNHGCSDRHGLEMVHLDAHANLIDPAGKAGRMACELAISISPIMAGVEKTAGQIWINSGRESIPETQPVRKTLRGPARFLAGMPWVIAGSPTRRSMDSSRGTAGLSRGFPPLR